MPNQTIKTKSQSGQNSEKAAIDLKEIGTEKKYQDLMANIDEGFCVIEMIYDADNNPIDYRFVEINSAFERITGLKNVIGKTINEVVPAHGPHWFEIFGKAARSGKSIQFQSAATALGRYYDILAYHIGGEGSRLVGILFNDITERKKAEEKLKQSEKRYRSLYENVMEGYANVKEKVSTPFAYTLKKLSLLFSILVVVIGILVLIGWAVNISLPENLSSKWVNMKVNTAICFLLAGFTVIILNSKKSEEKWRFWPSAFSLIVVCIATVILLEYIFHFNAGIDELFFKDSITRNGTGHPGRPAIQTASCFFLVGIALFLITVKKINILFFQGLNLTAGLVALFSLLGYLFGIQQLINGSSHTTIAPIHTSINFLLLVFASLFLLPESGIMKLVSSSTSGGRLIRRLLPLLILTVVISAWLSMEEKWTSFYDVYTGMTVYVTIIIVGFTIIIFTNANSLTRSENKIKKEREFSYYLLDTIPGILYLIDETGGLLKWNKNFESNTEYTAGEIADMKALDFISDEDRSLISGKLQEAFDKGESIAEANLKSKTGKLTPYYFTAKSITLEGRTLLLGTALDITDSKQASLYNRSLIEASLDPLVTISPEGKITDVNEATIKVTGVERTKLVGTDFSNYFTEPEKAKQGYQQVMKEGFVTDYPLTIHHSNGKCTEVLYNASVYKDIFGKTLGVFAAARDITATKIAEQERELYYKFFNTTQDIMVVADPLGCFKKVNPACLQLLGYGEEELISKPFVDFIYEEDKQRTSDEMAQQMQRGYSANFENRYVCKNGTLLWLSWRAQYSAEEGITYATARDITESRQMQQKLMASEVRLKEAQRLAKIGNWELDLLTRELKWSDEIYHIFELDPKVFGATYDAFLNAIHPADRDLVSHAYETSVANHTPYRIDHRLQMKDGRIKNVHEQCETFYDSSGKPIRSIGTVQDITERKQTENKIIESETKFRNIFDQSPVGKALVGVDKRFISCNPTFSKLLGYTESEIIGKTIADVTYPEDREIGMEEVKLLIDGKTKSFSAEKRYLRKDGSFVWAQVTTSLVRDAQGKALYLLPVVLDITERKMMEEMLRSANVYNRSLIEVSLDPLVTISPEGKITDVNNATIKATGFERTKLVGTDFSNYFTEPEKAKQGYQQVLKDGFVTDYPLTIRHKNGKNTEVLYNASVYEGTSGKILGVFAAARDVTAQRKAEEQLHKLNATLEEKVKDRTVQYETVNKELEAFTYSVSHDLRSPLRAVNSYSQILCEDYSERLDEDGKLILENIKYNTIKMGKLIDELLAFSRLGRKQLDRAEIDMNVLVNEVLDEFNNSTTHHAQIKLGQLPVVRADQTLMHQVMLNLISNAVKYSSKKEKPVVEIYAEEKGGKTVFAVKDNGVGFDMRYADKLFGVFQRLHSEKEFEGNGVGLAIVKRIINKHGGEVWASGEENKGANFYFILN